MIPEDDIIKVLIKDYGWKVEEDFGFMSKELIRNVAKIVEDKVKSGVDKDLLKKFLIWCYRVAKIDVVDPEINIEVKGYSSKDSVPIWDLEKLVSQFLLENKYG
jgi:hypothetical protein